MYLAELTFVALRRRRYAPDIPAINEPFLDLMLALNNASDPPRVVSTSYGEDEGSTSFAYARRVQMEFVKAGLRGVSLLFASGDSGVGTMWTSNSGGGGGDGASCSHFTPQWPAASPYVTSVGATSEAVSYRPISQMNLPLNSGPPSTNTMCRGPKIENPFSPRLSADCHPLGGSARAPKWKVTKLHRKRVTPNFVC